MPGQWPLVPHWSNLQGPGLPLVQPAAGGRLLHGDSRLEDGWRTAGGRGLQAWARDGAVGGERPAEEQHLSLGTLDTGFLGQLRT